MIMQSDLTIVFQGPVLGSAGAPGEITRRCIAEVRRQLPRAEIVLSTWKGAEAQAWPVDQLVISDDPGAWTRDDGVAVNCNRQIVSTLGGLRAGTRRYAAKLRTDTSLSSIRFLDTNLEQGTRPSQWRVFEKRILVLEKYTRDPARSSMLHFVSDLFQFGLREDLAMLWRVPLAEPANYIGWSKGVRPLLRAPFPNHSTFMRYADEQYVWLSCLAAHGIRMSLDYLSQCRLSDISPAEALITTNFLVANEAQAGVQLPEKFGALAYPETCYSSEEFSDLTRIYGENGTDAARARRRRQVWLGSQMALGRLAVRRLWPPTLLRSTIPASHPFRERYRRAKGKYSGDGDPPG